MNRVTLALALFAVLLSACEPGTTFIPRVVGGGGSDDFDMQPEVFRWQKQGQFGNTDYAQRKEDMIECGFPEGRDENSPSIFVRGLEETSEQMLARRKKFGHCMRDKGYVQLGLSECGPVKENRGICK